MYRTLIPGGPREAIRTVAGFGKESELWGRVLFLEHVTDSDWPAWRVFLEDYSHVIRAQDHLERTQFCVLLRGAAQREAPQSDVCLSVRTWDGVANHVDALLFASQAVGKRHGSSLLDRLAAETVARLSLWDTDLATMLADLPLDELLHPVPILKEVGLTRGWDGTRERSDEAWSCGAALRFEDDVRVHSSSLALRDVEREIDRRIWTAQVAVVYPHLEEQRRKLLERLRGRLVVPYTGMNGEVVREHLDLELTHIEQQLGSARSNGSEALRGKVRRLRHARNQLAHLETLSCEFLREPTFGR